MSLPNFMAWSASTQWSNWILLRKLKYSICCLRDTKNRKRCLKQHLKYFNFRSKIQLDHRVKGDSGRGRPRSPAQTVPPWSESLRPRRDQKKGIGVVGQRKCAAGGQGCNSLHFLSDVDLVKSLQVFQEILTPTLMYFYLLLAPESEASPWYPLENVSNPPPRAFAWLLRGDVPDKGEYGDDGGSAKLLLRGGADVPTLKVPHLEGRRYDVFRSAGAIRVGRIHVSWAKRIWGLNNLLLEIQTRLFCKPQQPLFNCHQVMIKYMKYLS